MAKKYNNTDIGFTRRDDGTIQAYQSPIGGKISASTRPQVAITVAEWRKAIDSARSTRMPRRRDLIDIFLNILFDGHLEAVMEKRKLAITTKKMVFVGAGGKNDDQVQKSIVEKAWFSQLLEGIMGAIDYEYSLLELVPGQDGLIKKVEDLDRRNVLSDYRYLAYDYVTTEPSSGAGLFYEEYSGYTPHPDARYLVEVRSRYKLGKLATASLLIILKRGSMADWADFCQIMGIPMRKGTYSPFDEKGRKLLQEALEEMGSNGYVIIPEGTDVDFASGGSTTGTSVFKELAEFCNSELSKLYLGQTMTTTDGSSRAQGEVHLEVEKMIHLSDMMWVEHVINDKVRDKLLGLGYKVPEGRFQFPDMPTIPMVDRIKIDVELSKVVAIPDDYWYNTYGIKKPSPAEIKKWEEKQKPAATAPSQEPASENEKEVQSAGKKPLKAAASLTTELNALYKAKDIPRLAHWPVNAVDPFTKVWERVANGIHSGRIKPGSVDPELFGLIKSELLEAVIKGLDDKYADVAFETFRNNLTKNVHVFSAFKTYQELRLATDLLKNDAGEIRPFSEFKEMILGIHQDYNVTYLQAEYQQALAATQMGAKWKTFENMKNVAPLLRFITAGDERVRDEHRRLDDITLPVDDSFWDRYYPPLDWGCRCDVEQVLSDGIRTELPSSLPSVKDNFAVNWGKKEVVFPPHHPYYKVRPEDKEQAEKLWDLSDE